MKLNAPQMQAVEHMAGPCLVIAGPGSGKTAVLTSRVKKLIDSGIPANEILVITFTKAAAIEMKERFNRLSEDIFPVTFGTFHSLFWGIIQKELGYKSSAIIMGPRRTAIIKEAMALSEIDTEDITLVNGYTSELSYLSNSTASIDEYEPQYVEKDKLKKLYLRYEELKQKYRVIDFDDMLIKAYGLLKKDPKVLEKWQSRFSYFLIDEMQDMNDLQFELMKMLSAKTNNVFCVGDDDQSIYGFRGANPKIMKDFTEFYTDSKLIVLDYNYRNPNNIVEAAGKLIGKNENRFDKEIKSTVEAGNILELHNDTLNDEAASIVEQITKILKEGGSLDKIAILYRNHSDARNVVDKLMNANIPIFLKEAMPNVYNHFIISDIETYFQISIGNATQRRMLSILNRPERFLHRQCVEEGADFKSMLRFYGTNPTCYEKVEALESDMRLISKMSPVAAVTYIRKIMGYDAFLRKLALNNGSEIEEYSEILEFITDVFRDCRNLKQAIDKLNILRLKVDSENKNRVGDKSGKVGLYTLHSSKGLEFENVFIISCNDGVIPSNKAMDKEMIEAERRLFYVGITRCQKNLYLSYTNKKNREKSRFLNEMKIDYSSSKSS